MKLWIVTHVRNQGGGSGSLNVHYQVQKAWSYKGKEAFDYMKKKKEPFYVANGPQADKICGHESSVRFHTCLWEVASDISMAVGLLIIT